VSVLIVIEIYNLLRDYVDNAEYISCSIILTFLQYYIRILCAELNDRNYFSIFCRTLPATKQYMYFQILIRLRSALPKEVIVIAIN